MQIETLAIDRLIPYARNSRTHSDAQVAQIAASIKEFGFTNPVLIDADGGIIAGHGRVMGARQLGLAEVPCIRLGHLTDAQRRAYVIADNRLALNAGWDDAMLALEMRDLMDEGYDVGLTGFDLKEIDALLAGLDATPEGQTDPDAAPAVQAEAVTKPGDVWLLGRHRIMCGDSTDGGSVALLMNGEKTDLCFTSPPYGAGNVAKLRDHYEPGAKHRKTFYDIHDDRPSEWLALMRGWYAAARDLCGVIVCNVQMLADNKIALVEWLNENRGELCDVAIWDKGHGAPQMQSCVMNNAFEFLLIFGGNGSRAIRFADWHGSVPNIVRINPHGKNEFAELHRAVMPVDLAMFAMQTLCNMATSVYEPFSGSGTTIIAAEQTGRRCYAMELSPNYVDVAVRRWQQYTGKRAVHAETGREFGE